MWKTNIQPDSSRKLFYAARATLFIAAYLRRTYCATMLTVVSPLSIISVDDLRKLVEKTGQKFEATLFSESATHVASRDGEVSGRV